MPKGIPKNGVNKGWFRKGFKHTEEQRKRISTKLKGIKRNSFSEEHRKHISESHKGLPAWNKGKKQSKETIEKLRKSLKGKHHSPNTEFRKGDIRITGKNNPNWKGGITPLNIKIRMSLEYRLWRESVFKRDNYTCIWCGERGGELNADHIKPFALYPELRFAIDNGRTLCVDCHKKTNSYLNRWIKK